MSALSAVRLGACVGALALGACALFGPADRAALAQDAASIEKCQELGRACKDDGGANCYQRYYDCTVDAGLR